MLDAMATAAAAPVDATLDIAQRRKLMDELTVAGFNSVAESGPTMVEEFTHRVPVADGVIRVRTYRPVRGGDLACYVYIHGGGWWLGNVDIYDGSCRAMADHLGCVVASVGYRLAPEHVFPTAAEDCYAALLWVAMNADALGVDGARIAVGGGSAGGNLAAVVALMARDRGGPRLRAQVLDIPATDLMMTSGSIDENGTGYLLTKTGMEECLAFYAPDHDEWRNPYASPMHATIIRCCRRPRHHVRVRPAARRGRAVRDEARGRGRTGDDATSARPHPRLASHGETDARRRPLQRHRRPLPPPAPRPDGRPERG